MARRTDLLDHRNIDIRVDGTYECRRGCRPEAECPRHRQVTPRKTLRGGIGVGLGRRRPSAPRSIRLNSTVSQQVTQTLARRRSPRRRWFRHRRPTGQTRTPRAIRSLKSHCRTAVTPRSPCWATAGRALRRRRSTLGRTWRGHPGGEVRGRPRKVCANHRNHPEDRGAPRLGCLPSRASRPSRCRRAAREFSTMSALEAFGQQRRQQNRQNEKHPCAEHQQLRRSEGGSRQGERSRHRRRP